MRFDELPMPVQDTLKATFEQEMRESFEIIQDEVLTAFLAQEDVAAQWQEYREATFRAEYYSFDAQCYFDDWIKEQGLS